MKNKTRKFLVAAALIPLLGGCDFMQNNVGKYLPTIGQPCNNWQCFTSSGEAESNAKQRQFNGGSSSTSTATQASMRTPLNGSDNPETAAPAPKAQQATPAAKTPFDMTPEELNGMPNPYGTPTD